MNTTDAVSLFATLFLTLAFVLLLAWFFIHWMGRISPRAVNSRHIRILDRVAVDRDKYLLLVSVGDKTMLIAMSSSSVEKLCDFSLDEKDVYFRETGVQQSFSAIIKQMMPDKKGGGEN